MTIFPLVQLNIILPELILILTSLVSLVLGAIRKESFFRFQLHMAVLVLMIALVIEANFLGISGQIFNHMLMTDRFIVSAKMVILAAATIILWMSFTFYNDHKNEALNEYPVLVLLSVAGMMFMISSNHLISLFISIELQTIAAYLLAALHRDQERSSEAGLKYFILGSLASGLLLFGMSFVYGFSGTAQFQAISQVLTAMPGVHIGLLTGLILMIVAMGFKVSAAPFHMWSPDVYQGAPTIITTFFMTAGKLAALIVLVRLLMQPFLAMMDQWQQVIIVMAVLSMLVGAFGAIQQTNIKRLLAYSSIGHVGYILIGLATGDLLGLQAVMIYLFIYVIATLGIFAVIMMLQDKTGAREEILVLSGLAKRQPIFAVVIALFMLSLAGIPPLAGFLGKFYIFMAAVKAQMYAVAVIGVLSSVIGAYYYLRIIKMMYFDEPVVDLVGQEQFELKIVMIGAVLFNIGLIVYFSPVLEASEWIVQVFF